MEVLVRTTITDAMLVSSTAPEDSTAEWVSGATYAIGDLRWRATTHMVYERLTAGAGTTVPELAKADWKAKRPTNRWAMFDSQMNTVTQVASPLTVVLKPGNFNAVGAYGIQGATSVTVTVLDAPGGNVIRTWTSSLEESAPADWWEYWFMPFKPATDFVLSDIEPYVNAQITVTFTGPGTVGVAMLDVGDLRPMGDTQWGPESSPQDYSYVDIDSDGNNVVMKGKSAKDMSAVSEFDPGEANRIDDTVHELLGVPSMWIASRAPEHRPLRCFGLGTGKVTFPDRTRARLSLSVKGLI